MKVASGADPRAADVAASSAGETQLSTPWVWLGLANAGDDVSTGDDHRSSNHLRCPCRSRHSDAGQRRCPRIMASFALLLPVLLIGIVPAVTSTSALHVLDDNLRYRDPPNKQTVDSAVAYLQEGQFLDRNDFYLLPHLANKLSRSGSTDKRVLNAIAVALQRHRKRITGYNAKATAMLLQSLARGRIDSPVLFSALGNHALACIAQFNAQGIASTAWAFATVSIEHRALFTAIAGRALAIMTEFKPQDVGNTAWAFATLSIENRELLHALAGRALTIMTEFSAQNVANTAWAFATLSFEDRALFDALGDRALATMTEFNSQGVANTAWAFAKSSIEDRELFDALAGRALMIMGQFSAQGVANTAWAFAKLSFEHSELFDALAGRALAVMIGFSAQNIANTAWAFATLSFENRALFNALGDRALATMTHFNAQSVTNTAWAFATLSIESRALFDALADHAVRLGLGSRGPAQVDQPAERQHPPAGQHRAIRFSSGTLSVTVTMDECLYTTSLYGHDVIAMSDGCDAG
ncbi:unnamed protein product (mitochondrion) [Plasmodiophora brassicae]|uniref:Uncharacterized protein n=1 Tax=Plasmodiophora brassicae TaxID=37360 RepID=A0A3P3YQ00_PLABS|nr:unnamed protein product [Plasmodiophora brassicae]